MKLLAWICVAALLTGALIYWSAWMEGAFEPTQDVTPDPAYDQQMEINHSSTTGTTIEAATSSETLNEIKY